MGYLAFIDSHAMALNESIIAAICDSPIHNMCVRQDAYDRNMYKFVCPQYQ